MKFKKYQVCEIESLWGTVTQTFERFSTLTAAAAEAETMIKETKRRVGALIVKDVVTGDEVWESARARAITRDLAAYRAIVP